MIPNQTSSFKVDPRIAEILGESYRSSEQALKELVDDSCDNVLGLKVWPENFAAIKSKAPEAENLEGL